MILTKIRGRFLATRQVHSWFLCKQEDVLDAGAVRDNKETIELNEKGELTCRSGVLIAPI